MKILVSFFFLSVMAFISGCVFDPEPPKCSDSETIQLVRKIVFDRSEVQSILNESIKEIEWNRLGKNIFDSSSSMRTQFMEKVSDATELEIHGSKNTQFDMILPTSYDASIKKYTCGADLKTKSRTLEIIFNSQLDDRNRHVVVVAAMDPLKFNGLIFDLAKNISEKRVLNAEKLSGGKMETLNDDLKVVNTPHNGVLEITGQFNNVQIAFNGKNLLKEDSATLSFVKKFTIGSDVVVLVENNSYGTSCPAVFFLITAYADGGVQVSPEFGTCSDIINVNFTGGSIVMSMPNMRTNGESQYVYSNSVIRENGTILLKE